MRFLEALRFLYRDARSEFWGRLAVYKDDWLDGWRCGYRILAPSVYIMFASALPALAFGQQLAEYTNGTLTVVHVLTATAMTGLLQSVLGGQPLLIVGVAEPIVLVYKFLYEFLQDRPEDERPEYVAWCAWTCVWTAIMLTGLAAFNTGGYVAWITPLSGELFGMLIAVLFMQQAIKGTISEFRKPKLTDASTPTGPDVDWVINGLWALIIATGLVCTAIALHLFRGYKLLVPKARSFLADYGAPLMVVVWSAAGYIAADALPGGDPRRITTPNTWEVKHTWSVAARMGDVSVPYVFAALIPALIITCLFWFDHGVSSLLAQQSRFGLKRPPAFNWDLQLLAVMTLACGLLGIPPVNGVLPQAPMHTSTLVTLREELAAAEKRRALKPPRTARKRTVADAVATWGLQLGLGGRGGGGRGGGGLPHIQSSPELHDAGQEKLESEPHACTIELHPIQERSGRGGAVAPDDNAPRSLSGRDTSAADGCTAAGASRHAHGTSVVDVSVAATAGSGGAAAAEGSAYGELKARTGSAAAAGEDAGFSNGGSFVGSNDHGSGCGRSGAADDAADGAANGSANGDIFVPPGLSDAAQIEADIELLKAHENRLSNFIQSGLCVVLLFLTPLIKLIPTSVLWGYFAYMALASLPGNDFWERLVLLISDPVEWRAYIAGKRPVRVTPLFLAMFTAAQFVTLAGIWALVTWAGIVGVIFPVPILAIVPVRTFILPRLMRQSQREQLAALDPCDMQH